MTKAHVEISADQTQPDISATINDQRWLKVLNRDKAARNFVFAVKSTGIYCLACCPARRPALKNVSFYSDAKDAEADGYRPCKRCKPDQPDHSDTIKNIIERACRLIEQVDRIPTLQELANVSGLSQFYFQRQFKAITGLTPKKYAQSFRTERMREALTVPCNNITQAIYEAGFQSSAAFYEQAGATLGMTPTTFKKGGKNMEIRFAIAECTLGYVLIAATDKGICAVTLGDDPALLIQNLQDRFPQAEFKNGDSDFEKNIAAVINHIENPAQNFDLPLDIQGTVFQQKVWQALRDIPSGKTASYSDLANSIGQPAASRAVAGACAANKIAVIIPCHRIVRQNGDLSGYRWGVERKRALLLKEQNNK
ncbi:bifunctional DNA-binding transcriptional regulator/O6-methylguanine-DNA methyltransferase Ada [Brucellaceae bacterium C25G]